MTKDEIKALVAAKIAGQGSAIDAASVLPAILNGIIDAIPTVEAIGEKITSLGTITSEKMSKLRECVYLEYEANHRRYVRISTLPIEVRAKIEDVYHLDSLDQAFGHGISDYSSDGSLNSADFLIIGEMGGVYNIIHYEI